MVRRKGVELRVGFLGKRETDQEWSEDIGEQQKPADDRQDVPVVPEEIHRGPPYQAISFVTRLPCTSVKRNCRPWNLNVSFVWSKPSSCRSVACRSWTWTRSVTALKPNSSDSPSVRPGLMPPPANHIVKAFG